METTPAAPLSIAPGTPMGGGFYAGLVKISGQVYALVIAPKATGETKGSWHKDYADVPGAKHYDDGRANTRAMAEAGCPLAAWALTLKIDGVDDWYLPSQDELEICYRNLKPTEDENHCYARSGINLAAPELTRPYTPEMPAQTTAEAFKEGGLEAFDPAWYWSSSQHATDSDFAWGQRFLGGYQDSFLKSYEGRARAVRRFPI
ncbi:DUF1566 domain-containing protein [Thauera sp. 27]|uniref:DUF1566 domain-containing protein n=1 Tax=Thauera sp. 27 TaxID=305700 RepID=UPI00056288E4|nr:DUF1566 domain-containing protein [Thauera sp. 27]